MCVKVQNVEMVWRWALFKTKWFHTVLYERMFELNWPRYAWFRHFVARKPSGVVDDICLSVSNSFNIRYSKEPTVPYLVLSFVSFAIPQFGLVQLETAYK